LKYIETAVFTTEKMPQKKLKTPGSLMDMSKLGGGQMLKSLLPYYVLGLLAQGDMYGKKILESIADMTRGSWRPSPGLIYPLLKKIVRLGYATEYLDDSQGHPRRFYNLTTSGEECLLQMQKEIGESLQKTIEVLSLHLEKIKKIN
jgi:DNA-binding PadR family transcriptional regulator